jgi:hypothetical protein
MEQWILKTAWDSQEYMFNTENTPGDWSYDSRYHLLKGAYGHHGMPRTYTSDVIPNIAGEELREELIGKRELYMPIRIQGYTAAERELNKQLLRKSLSYAQSVIELQITNELGETRSCFCKYESGFELSPDDANRSFQSMNIPLKMVAFDPYFYDIAGNAIVHVTAYEAPVNLFFDSNPWFCSPWRLASSAVARDWVVFNDGDADAYPVWTIAGPGVAPSLMNVTTGESFLLNYTLTVDEVVTIDMREDGATSHTVTSVMPDGTTTNLRKFMDANQRDMWALIPGPNEISLEMDGGAGEALVTFTFLQRFEGI